MALAAEKIYLPQSVSLTIRLEGAGFAPIRRGLNKMAIKTFLKKARDQVLINQNTLVSIWVLYNNARAREYHQQEALESFAEQIPKIWDSPQQPHWKVVLASDEEYSRTMHEINSMNALLDLCSGSWILLLARRSTKV